MPDESPAPDARSVAKRDPWPLPTWLPQASVWIGVICGISGASAGVVKMLHRVEAACRDGRMWGPDETDPICHAHPQLGTGIAITAGSIIGALLIILVAYIASEVARPRAGDSV